ncbi:monocarboxylate transporter 14-like [Oratosquilla oratoria]|uniref:monocarboxylate transporter 14-like n=1 Tax=Oratosquilla oratoria TaxID=337810 RepID=UPI003F76B4F8
MPLHPTPSTQGNSLVSPNSPRETSEVAQKDTVLGCHSNDLDLNDFGGHKTSKTSFLDDVTNHQNISPDSSNEDVICVQNSVSYSDVREDGGDDRARICGLHCALPSEEKTKEFLEKAVRTSPLNKEAACNGRFEWKSRSTTTYSFDSNITRETTHDVTSVTGNKKTLTYHHLELKEGDEKADTKNLARNNVLEVSDSRRKSTRDGKDGSSSMRSSKSPDVDGGWAWVVFAAAFLSFFVSSGMYYSFSVFFVQLLLEFGESRAHTAWIYSTNSAVHMFSGPIGGWVITRWGPRRAVILGGVLACLGYALSSMARDLNVLFFTFGIINAVGTSLNYSGWLVGLARFFEKRHALAVGLAMSGSGVGVFFMGPLINTLVEELGWRSAMLLNAGFSLNFCVFGATIYSKLRKNPGTTSHVTHTPSAIEELLVGEKKTEDVVEEEVSSKDSGVSVDLEEEKRSLSSIGSGCGTKTVYLEDIPLPSLVAAGSVWSLPPQEVTRSRYWLRKMRKRVGAKKNVQGSISYDEVKEDRTRTKKKIYCSPPFWFLQASCFFSFMGTITMSAILKDWTCYSGLEDAFSMSLSATGLGDLLGRMLAGLVTSHATKRGTSPLYLFGAVQVFLGASVFAASLSNGPELLVTAMAAIGVGCGLQSVLYALIPSYLAPPSALAQVLGYLLLVTGIGALTGPPLAGVLVDTTGSYDPVLGFCAITPLLAAGLSVAAECSRPG